MKIRSTRNEAQRTGIRGPEHSGWEGPRIPVIYPWRCDGESCCHSSDHSCDRLSSNDSSSPCTPGRASRGACLAEADRGQSDQELGSRQVRLQARRRRKQALVVCRREVVRQRTIGDRASSAPGRSGSTGSDGDLERIRFALRIVLRLVRIRPRPECLEPRPQVLGLVPV